MYDFQIEDGPGFAQLHVELKAGEQIKAEGGAMAYMDGTVSMETQSGGLMKGLKRSLSGESFFQNTFTGPGAIAFANMFPGDILKIEVNEPWILSKDVYIAGSPHLEVSSKWGGLKSIIGGEGGFLSHVSSPDGTPGVIFVGGYGYLKKHEIPAGKEFIVDTGIFFAAPEGTEFKIDKVGGKKSFVFGGEGFVMKFMGPCTLYTQSRGQDGFVNLLAGSSNS